VISPTSVTHNPGLDDRIRLDCEYGNAPFRPLFIAVALALLAIPFYWLGFRQRLWGGQLIRTESEAGGSWRPSWEIRSHCPAGGRRSMRAHSRPAPPPKTPGSAASGAPLAPIAQADRIELAPSALGSRLSQGGVLFSLISVVNLGSKTGLCRWSQPLFSEYTLRPAAGCAPSLASSPSSPWLFALSLLSFFGHRFE